MGLIDRIRRITAARIEAFLASVEDPEAVLPQLIAEMGAKVDQAVSAEAKALSAVKGARRRLDEATGRAARMRQGARLALAADDVETARQAIAAELEAERRAETLADQVDKAQSAYLDASTARKQLQELLSDLKTRSDDVLARARAAGRRQTDARALGKRRARREGLLEAVARMEEKVDAAEAETEIRDEIAQALGPDFPEQRIRELERDAEVQRRLDALKENLTRE